jgi:NADH-quinone oxidoreductase subunit L
VVVSIGVVTALMASLIALAQFDIKRILAYSTVSQLGLMMVSLGVGGVAAGIMHLIAHGCFKALLFLGAGSVIHGLHHEQDIRKMGGLRWIMPVTFLTYAIGMMNLSGVPFFFAGGWTKEEILHRTADWPLSRLPHYLMLAGVILTALYMTRQMIYVFFGNARRNIDLESVRPSGLQPAEERAKNISARHTGQSPMFQPHESPRVMTVPLIVLAVCSILLAIFLTPAWPWLHAYLSGEPVRLDRGALIQQMLLLSLVLVAAGIGLGWLMYRNAGESDPLARAQPGLFRFLANKMWFDEIYQRTVIGLARIFSRLSDFLDRYFWDGLVSLLAGVGQAFAVLTKGLDDHGINAGVDKSTAAARGFGRLIAARHSGQIQTYLGAIAIGMLLLLVLYVWLV